MKGSRFNEEQIIAILREQEAGAKTADVCRKHGISSATFYKWKSKYGGLEVSDARRLKVLEDGHFYQRPVCSGGAFLTGFDYGFWGGVSALASERGGFWRPMASCDCGPP
jgi:putative transposase